MKNPRRLEKCFQAFKKTCITENSSEATVATARMIFLAGASAMDHCVGEIADKVMEGRLSNEASTFYLGALQEEFSEFLDYADEFAPVEGPLQ